MCVNRDWLPGVTLLRVDGFHYEGLPGKPWVVLLNLSSIGDMTRRPKPVRVYAYYSLVFTLCREQGSIAFCLMWKTQTYIIKTMTSSAGKPSSQQ